MAKIYHYTTIDTLALIMLNKTIRFNRLDRVDDEEESIFGSGDSDVKIGKYIFVSCWTKEKDENPVLWKYIADKAGNNNVVRIALDENMFVSYPVKFSRCRTFFKNHYENRGDCYFHYLANIIELHDVKYVDDNEARIRKLMEEGYDEVTLKIQELGIYKNKEKWEKQKECRFRLIAFPTTMKFESGNYEMGQNSITFLMHLMDSLVPLLRRNFPISLLYEDIPLNEKVLNSIEVTMGPETTKEDKEKVKKLLYPCPITRLFSKRKLIDSQMKNNIQTKIKL